MRFYLPNYFTRNTEGRIVEWDVEVVTRSSDDFISQGMPTYYGGLGSRKWSI